MKKSRMNEMRSERKREKTMEFIRVIKFSFAYKFVSCVHETEQKTVQNESDGDDKNQSAIASCFWDNQNCCLNCCFFLFPF